MAPRPYNLGARAASVEETKRKIVAAATEELADKGIDGTSMSSVARRADVAPGTVHYHFDSMDDLVSAVVSSWVDEIGMPDPSVVDPMAPLADRVRALVATLFDTYDRSEWAYEIWRQNPEHPAYVAASESFYGVIGQMMVMAAGEHAGEPFVMQVLSVLSDPGFRGTLLARGMTPDQAIDVATELGVAWMEHRS